MNINWFPGHMTKSLRMMEKEVKNVDVIIYLLDARAPQSSFNPKFESIIGNKPVLYVLNKYDLADDKKTDEFIKKLKKSGATAIKLDASKSGAGKVLEPLLKQLISRKIEKFLNKGIKILPKAMIIGVPNVGKSTLINNLANVSKAKTGNKAGVTRGKQQITLESGIVLLDTPGTLWPSFDREETALNLAIIGSINDNVLDKNEIAYGLISVLKAEYPEKLKARYNLKELDKTTHEIAYDIAVSRGFLLKGGDFDMDRTCNMLITEYRKGLFGKITLD
ncbi:MAG: ribosome biogenesis GTPase YlqF [Christensenellales bacterium]